jgi:hypothetical protein
LASTVEFRCGAFDDRFPTRLLGSSSQRLRASMLNRVK